LVAVIGGEMKNILVVILQFIQHLIVRDRAFCKPNAGVVGDIRSLRREKVIDDMDGLHVETQQTSNQVTAYETGPTGNQNS
jgi:hypothetical protein